MLCLSTIVGGVHNSRLHLSRVKRPYVSRAALKAAGWLQAGLHGGCREAARVLGGEDPARSWCGLLASSSSSSSRLAAAGGLHSCGSSEGIFAAMLRREGWGGERRGGDRKREQAVGNNLVR